MNSNAINVAVGFLLPATIVGVGGALGPARLVAAWYLGLTILALGCAYAASGLRRRARRAHRAGLPRLRRGTRHDRDLTRTLDVVPTSKPFPMSTPMCAQNCGLGCRVGPVRG
jgi:hypothetical protein